MKKLEDILLLISNPNRTIFKSLLDTFPFFYTSQGSANKHHAWKGGYIDHVTECLNIAICLYGGLNKIRPLPFSLEDCLVVLFLHDLEKPFLYAGLVSFEKRIERHEYRKTIIQNAGISLTYTQEIALKYVEGEVYDYHPTERVMNELGALCHSCDVLSARCWYDFPRH